MTTTPAPYSYPDLLAIWDDLPDIKIRYNPTETGWGKRLAPTHGCLANCSTSNALRMYDIVELRGETETRWPRAGKVLQTYYAHTLHVRYPAGATEAATLATFKWLHARIQEVGGQIEGCFPGLAIANIPEVDDLQKLLQRLQRRMGVRATHVRFETKAS